MFNIFIKLLSSNFNETLLFKCHPVHLFFFINNLFSTLAPKIAEAFLKNRPKKLFSNCLVDGLLTSIAQIFKHSKRRHSLLQLHLEYVMHAFELTGPNVSISLRFPMQKKGI